MEQSENKSNKSLKLEKALQKIKEQAFHINSAIEKNNLRQCLFVLIFLSGEYKKLYTYFADQLYLTGVNQEEGTFIGFVFFTTFSCCLVIILNSSFFMSNEKNSSMFTILLANTKDLFTSILSYFFLTGNKFTVNIVLGLLISTTGAVMFSSKSICDNMITGEQKPEISNANYQPQVVEIKIDENQDNQDN